MTTADLIRKSRDTEPFTQDELEAMLALPPDSADSLQLMAEANRISTELCANQAEIHAQFALNLAPCPCNCSFCSFAACNGVFTRSVTLQADEAVALAQQFETAGANAIYVMTTAQFPFAAFIELSQAIRAALRPETVLIANVGDLEPPAARQLRDTGYQGVYHALRLREGVDSGLDPAVRRRSIRIFQEAGLSVGTCVEPVGPEHSDAELAEMILYTASINPAYSGAARRIAIPGTPMARRGMISELRMAQIVAVTRMAMPRTTLGNCTHEPCTLGGLAGATLFWAESGANPRDTRPRTEEGRGESVADCRALFHECGWEALSGPSRFFVAEPTQGDST